MEPDLTYDPSILAFRPPSITAISLYDRNENVCQIQITDMFLAVKDGETFGPRDASGSIQPRSARLTFLAEDTKYWKHSGPPEQRRGRYFGQRTVAFKCKDDQTYCVRLLPGLPILSMSSPSQVSKTEQTLENGRTTTHLRYLATEEGVTSFKTVKADGLDPYLVE